MNPARFFVEESLCVGCGRCVNVCPGGVLSLNEQKKPVIQEFSEFGWDGCWQCEHCLAVCPKGAVSILGHRPEDSLLPVPPETAAPVLDALIANQTWEPESTISAATLVLTLARMSNADLELYRDAMLEEDLGLGLVQENNERRLTEEQALAVFWAANYGLLENVVASGQLFPGNQETMPRSQLALILANYLRNLPHIMTDVKNSVAVIPVADSAAFPDGGGMSEAENVAFQIVRQAKILEGDSLGSMLPRNSSKDFNNNPRTLACLRRPGLRCRRLQSTKDCSAPSPRP